MSRIVIIGGHGKVARLLIPRLAKAKHQVAAVIRKPEHVTDATADGAQPLLFDIEQADTQAIAEQIAGYDAVVWSAGAGGGNPARTYAVDRDAAIRTIDAAERAGVARFVMVSYLAAGQPHGLDPSDSFYPYAQAKAEADAHLRASGLSWTILGPGRLTLEPASGRITLDPAADRPSRDTSRANVAWVIEAVLKRSASIGKTIGFIDGDTPIDDVL